MFHHAFMLAAAQAIVAKFLETFKEFPPVQKPNSFTIGEAKEKMSEAAAGG
jgi:arylsulfatase